MFIVTASKFRLPWHELRPWLKDCAVCRFSFSQVLHLFSREWMPAKVMSKMCFPQISFPRVWIAECFRLISFTWRETTAKRFSFWPDESGKRAQLRTIWSQLTQQIWQEMENRSWENSGTVWPRSNVNEYNDLIYIYKITVIRLKSQNFFVSLS